MCASGGSFLFTQDFLHDNSNGEKEANDEKLD
jgi:hypothetical protein